MKLFLALFVAIFIALGLKVCLAAQVNEAAVTSSQPATGNPVFQQLLGTWTGTWGRADVTLKITGVADGKLAGTMDLRSSKLGASGPQNIVGTVAYRGDLIVLSFIKTGRYTQHFDLTLVEPDKLQGQGSSAKTEDPTPTVLIRN